MNTAKSIVSTHKSESDYNKLLSYKDEICSLVSYNSAAADDDDMPYGNPWQLIWVFDGDESTEVVCEGYSKAFKYLCDLSSFRSSVSCNIATGYMQGGTGAGPHMWNLVAMSDGNNYLVDVTNCDQGTIGYPDKLFMAGYSSIYSDDNGNSGYYFMTDSILYVYDGSIVSMYEAGQLAVSGTDYDPSDEPVVIPEITHTLPADLLTIDEQAFAGIPEDAVVFIPDTVESIAADAFDGGIVIVTPAGSYAAQWAEENGLTVYEQEE